MPDIAMCHGQDCPQRENCWRYKAKPNGDRQAYADFDARRDGPCTAYWPMKKEQADA